MMAIDFCFQKLVMFKSQKGSSKSKVRCSNLSFKYFGHGIHGFTNISRDVAPGGRLSNTEIRRLAATCASAVPALDVSVIFSQ